MKLMVININSFLNKKNTFKEVFFLFKKGKLIIHINKGVDFNAWVYF